MSYVVRAASVGDLEGVYRMAKGTGGGFTNLPPNRPTLREKLERAERAFASDGSENDGIGDELFMFILENTETKKAVGTCLIFTRIGGNWPFYSYRLGTISQTSKELNRTFRAELLTLCTDLEGASEVGGLFLDANERSAGIGKLLARSRYLFIATHRARFADRMIAELRGALDDVGNSPFWDGLAGRFFGMTFREADDFNAVHGNQFIADLMPKHPIYTAMLPDTARAVMGLPHVSGRPAMRMLEKEGFAWEHYVDIFDGGPTMTVNTDRIRTVREAQSLPVKIGAPGEGAQASLIAAGELGTYRACHAPVAMADNHAVLSADAAALLKVSEGERVTFVSA